MAIKRLIVVLVLVCGLAETNVSELQMRTDVFTKQSKLKRMVLSNRA